MPGRNANPGLYRYGFQNQETDPEMLGGAVSFKYRIYDPRIGRFLSIDPLFKKYPYNSSYAFQENKLGMGIEFEGLELQQTQKAGGVETTYGENGEMTGQVSNEPASTTSISPIVFPVDKPQEQSTTSSTPTFGPQATISTPRLSPEGQKALTFQGNLNKQIGEFQIADPFMYGGTGNGLGLASGMAKALKEAPGVLIPELALSKIYSAAKMNQLSYNAFRTLNKGVFTGANHMQKTSLAFQTHKLIVINFNTNLIKTIDNVQAGLSLFDYGSLLSTPFYLKPNLDTNVQKP